MSSSDDMKQLDDEMERAGFHGYEDCVLLDPRSEGSCPTPYLCSEKGSCGQAPAAPPAIEAVALTVLEQLCDVLESHEFESGVLRVDGLEPFASLDMGMGLVLDLTATLRAWCDCCDIDGTHHHERCDHPCCPDHDIEEP